MVMKTIENNASQYAERLIVNRRNVIIDDHDNAR